MKNELKYFFYIFTILTFIIFVGNYYFSDKNKKNFFRSIIIHDNNIIKYSESLKILNSDTNNIIEYVENDQSKNKKKYNFWDLIFKDEK